MLVKTAQEPASYTPAGSSPARTLDVPMVMGFPSAVSVAGNWQPLASRSAKDPATIPGRMNVMEVLMLSLVMGMVMLCVGGRNLVTERAHFHPGA
ncbi:hypothetical protein GCM10010253_64100 [Streptomyces badius]|uniref:Uncharacterized protein n=1 Tax=Streptomyces badius TaxID=1941 RepID=A0ABQ2TNE6_STRBA|nr:hypothetical protein GCM10010253_64100 [Streptomyces badius]